MIIEKLNIDDLPQVLELYNNLTPFETPISKSIETYEEMLMDENYYLAVAKEDNKIVGTALGICCRSLEVSFLVIEDVVVKDGLRGKGVGKRLMEALDEFSKTKNCAYSILVSSAHRDAAHKFYEKSGFVDEVRGFRKVYDQHRRKNGV